MKPYFSSFQKKKNKHKIKAKRTPRMLYSTGSRSHTSHNKISISFFKKNARSERKSKQKQPFRHGEEWGMGWHFGDTWERNQSRIKTDRRPKKVMEDGEENEIDRECIPLLSSSVFFIWKEVKCHLLSCHPTSSLFITTTTYRPQRRVGFFAWRVGVASFHHLIIDMDSRTHI